MEQLFGEAGRVLLTQGLLGVLVLILMLVVAVLYRENRDLNRARAADAEKLGAALERTTAALNEYARAMGDRRVALEELARTIVEQGRAAETEGERLRERLDRIERAVEAPR